MVYVCSHFKEEYFEPYFKGALHYRVMYNIRRVFWLCINVFFFCFLSISYILNGNSEIVTHVWSDFGYMFDLLKSFVHIDRRHKSDSIKTCFLTRLQRVLISNLIQWFFFTVVLNFFWKISPKHFEEHPTRSLKIEQYICNTIIQSISCSYTCTRSFLLDIMRNTLHSHCELNSKHKTHLFKVNLDSYTSTRSFLLDIMRNTTRSLNTEQ